MLNIAERGVPAASPAERELLALCMGLGARRVAGWSDAEDALVAGLPRVTAAAVAAARRRIGAGEDPLGEAFTGLRAAAERRARGATYTPAEIVRAMVGWAGGQATPDRVVDAGVGSARFLVAAGRRFPAAELLGVEIDTVAAVLARGHLAAAKLAGRSRVLLADYRDAVLPTIPGRTLYIGNPPYVRHHQIEPWWKAWFVAEAKRLGLAASQLAGLHAHFFLATALRARPGDLGSFITAAEWLDVNYGGVVRDLFLNHLGGRQIVVIDPTATPFPDALTTGVITNFEVGSRPATVSYRRASTMADLHDGAGEQAIDRADLGRERQWSRAGRPARPARSGYVELGELCRVHRGQVTGSNETWIAGPHAAGLPASVLFPTVTRAKELFAAGRELRDASALRRVIDLPVDLDGFDAAQRRAIDAFLERCRAAGIPAGYIASKRRAWWSVGLREPAPILATYMARRPPGFVRNRAGARHINIAHGLYPREDFGDAVLARLVDYLATGTVMGEGRTYAGGLTKFEPGEMGRILVPDLATLEGGGR